MRSVIANNGLMVALAGVIIIVGLIAGFCVQDFVWFARSGSLVVAVGLTLISRASIIGKDVKLDVITADTGLSYLDPEHWKRLGQLPPDYVIEDWKTRAAVGKWGPIVSFAGTLIWGFGDLLNKVFCSGT